MFLTADIPALFKKGTLKLVPNEDGDGIRRVAEAMLVIEPFPVKLAREMGDEIANHLFDDDDTIRMELESIDLRVRAGLQNVTVRPDEALEPIAILTPVSIKDVSATVIDDKKTQRRWLSFSFVLVFSLETREARNFVLDQFGRTLLWSFEAMQRDLLRQADLHETAARLGEHGSATLETPDGERISFDEHTSKKHRQIARNLRDAAKAH